MKTCLYVSAFLLLFGFNACEEDTVEADRPNPPQLEVRGVRADRFSFAATIEEDGVNGQLYFLVQTSDQPAMTAEAVQDSQWATSLALNGADFRTASMPGLQSKTDYTLYAVIMVGEQLSQVATLQVSTM